MVDGADSHHHGTPQKQNLTDAQRRRHAAAAVRKKAFADAWNKPFSLTQAFFKVGELTEEHRQLLSDVHRLMDRRQSPSPVRK